MRAGLRGVSSARRSGGVSIYVEIVFVSPDELRVFK